ncbi:MAG: aminotransferase class V-fold PLP-dependent enzyme, partial [Gemmatimonadota bacterium]
EAGAVLHSDVAQALGKVAVDVSEVPVDLLSGTGHKIYAPKGTGFLFAREGTPVAPLIHGGGQERALRPGTEDVAGAVGLATAVHLAVAERQSEGERLAALRSRMERGLLDRLDDIRVNAGSAERAPHVLSIGVGGLEDGNALVMALDLEGFGVSGGSACASGSTKGSHVMEALYGADDGHASVRFSFGRGTTETDVDRAVEATVTVVTRMRAL